MAIIDVVSAALFFPEVLRMMIIFDLKADLLAHPMLTNHSIYIRTVLDSEQDWRPLHDIPILISIDINESS